MATKSLIGVLAALLLAGPLAWARTPDDPEFGRQWYLERIGMPTAWNTADGSGVVVAIIDSGISMDHEDFRDRLWVNPGEIAGTGDDDDGNGFADDIHGWNWTAWDHVIEDDFGHGTFVAGVLAASANNGYGVAGVAGGWSPHGKGAVIMPLKVTRAGDAGEVRHLAEAIEYAVDNGAMLMNISVGTQYHDPRLEQAVEYAHERGVLMVAAAGNALAGSSGVDYPAAYDQVMAVGGVDRHDRPTNFSPRGPQIEIVAPAVDIYGIEFDGGYSDRWGTSYSAAQVTGVAALIMQSNPELTAEEVRQRLTSTAAGSRDRSESMGWGRLDAAAAMGCEALDRTPPWVEPHTPAPGAVVNSFPDRITLRVGDDICGVDFRRSSVTLTTRGRRVPGRVIQEPGPELVFEIHPSARLGDGWFTVEAEVLDFNGNVNRGFSMDFEVDSTPPLLKPAQTRIVTAEDRAVISGLAYDSGGVGVEVHGVETRVFLGRFRAAVELDSELTEVEVTARDPAGNVATRIVTVVRDRTGPKIADPSPPGGGVSGSPRPRVSVRVADERSAVDPDALEFVFQGRKMKANWDPDRDRAWFTPTADLEEGRFYSVQARAADILGNRSEVFEWSFGVDLSPPELSLAPLRSPTNKRRVYITGTARDESELRVLIDGVEPEFKGGLFTRLVELEPGSNEFEVVAEDAAGNRTVERVVVALDLEPPQLTVAKPASASTVFATSPVFHIKGRTGGVSVSANGVPGTVEPDGGFEIAYELSPGENRIEIRARSEAGNEAVSRRIIVLALPPSVDILAPEPGSVVRDRVVALRGSVSGAVMVMVNDVRVEEFADLDREVELTPGLNRISVVASGPFGNRTEVVVEVTYEP